MPKKAVGGPRDSVFTVRLPARLRFGLELTARLYGEPMTDVLVRGLNEALSSESGGLFVDLPGEDAPTYLLPKVWDERESVRLVKLALVYPALLTRSQQLLWKLVRDDPRFWMESARSSKAANKRRRIEDLQADILEAEWGSLVRDGDRPQ